MSGTRRAANVALVFVLFTALLLWTIPVSAHRADLINGRRAGPLRSGATTLDVAEEWFGPADDVRRVVVGCDVPLKKARWPGRLVVFFGRGPEGTATETKVFRRTVRSTVHGGITVHTRKGLRIGDAERKLRGLYPGVIEYRHRGKDWYILRSSPTYGRLVAAVEQRRVVILRSAPWEYC